MKQRKNKFIPQTKILDLQKSFPRKIHNRRFVHSFLVSDQEQLRFNRQIQTARNGGGKCHWK